MARLPRLSIANQVHHVIQRGDNRQPVFLDQADHLLALSLLARAAEQFQVLVHAFVLMPNHLHLLCTPAQAGGVSSLMQAFGRSYVPQHNRRHGRTGTLWEGRYRCTVIQASSFLLPCVVYMDLNPVRAALVPQAQDYPWSSMAHHTGTATQPWLTPHPLYWALGNTPSAREAAYAAAVSAGISPQMEARITRHTLAGWALGDDAFVNQLQATTERRLSPVTVGRPRKTP